MFCVNLFFSVNTKSISKRDVVENLVSDANAKLEQINENLEKLRVPSTDLRTSSNGKRYSDLSSDDNIYEEAGENVENTKTLKKKSDIIDHFRSILEDAKQKMKYMKTKTEKNIGQCIENTLNMEPHEKGLHNKKPLPSLSKKYEAKHHPEQSNINHGSPKQIHENYEHLKPEYTQNDGYEDYYKNHGSNQDFSIQNGVYGSHYNQHENADIVDPDQIVDDGEIYQNEEYPNKNILGAAKENQQENNRNIPAQNLGTENQQSQVNMGDSIKKNQPIKRPTLMKNIRNDRVLNKAENIQEPIITQKKIDGLTQMKMKTGNAGGSTSGGEFSNSDVILQPKNLMNLEVEETSPMLGSATKNKDNLPIDEAHRKKDLETLLGVQKNLNKIIKIIDVFNKYDSQQNGKKPVLTPSDAHEIINILKSMDASKDSTKANNNHEEECDAKELETAIKSFSHNLYKLSTESDVSKVAQKLKVHEKDFHNLKEAVTKVIDNHNQIAEATEKVILKEAAEKVKVMQKDFNLQPLEAAKKVQNSNIVGAPMSPDVEKDKTDIQHAEQMEQLLQIKEEVNKIYDLMKIFKEHELHKSSASASNPFSPSEVSAIKEILKSMKQSRMSSEEQNERLQSIQEGNNRNAGLGTDISNLQTLVNSLDEKINNMIIKQGEVNKVAEKLKLHESEIKNLRILLDRLIDMFQQQDPSEAKGNIKEALRKLLVMKQDLENATPEARDVLGATLTDSNLNMEETLKQLEQQINSLTKGDELTTAAPEAKISDDLDELLDLFNKLSVPEEVESRSGTETKIENLEKEINKFEDENKKTKQEIKLAKLQKQLANLKKERQKLTQSEVPESRHDDNQVSAQFLSKISQIKEKLNKLNADSRISSKNLPMSAGQEDASKISQSNKPNLELKSGRQLPLSDDIEHELMRLQDNIDNLAPEKQKQGQNPEGKTFGNLFNTNPIKVAQSVIENTKINLKPGFQPATSNFVSTDTKVIQPAPLIEKFVSTNGNKQYLPSNTAQGSSVPIISNFNTEKVITKVLPAPKYDAVPTKIVYQIPFCLQPLSNNQENGYFAQPNIHPATLNNNVDYSYQPTSGTYSNTQQNIYNPEQSHDGSIAHPSSYSSQIYDPSIVYHKNIDSYPSQTYEQPTAVSSNTNPFEEASSFSSSNGQVHNEFKQFPAEEYQAPKHYQENQFAYDGHDPAISDHKNTQFYEEPIQDNESEHKEQGHDPRSQYRSQEPFVSSKNPLNDQIVGTSLKRSEHENIDQLKSKIATLEHQINKLRSADKSESSESDTDFLQSILDSFVDDDNDDNRREKRDATETDHLQWMQQVKGKLDDLKNQLEKNSGLLEE